MRQQRIYFIFLLVMMLTFVLQPLFTLETGSSKSVLSSPFREGGYTITVEKAGEGGIILNGEIIADYPHIEEFPGGTILDLEAFAHPGWGFVKWKTYNLDGTSEDLVNEEIELAVEEIHIVRGEFNPEDSPLPPTNPNPPDGASDVSPEGFFSWLPTIRIDFPDPVGYVFKLLGLDRNGKSEVLFETITDVPFLDWSLIINSPGWSEPIYGQQFQWQVIPFAGSPTGKGSAFNCPIWSFSTIPDPSLPVVLSSFTATITTNMFVQLEWIAETETDLLGYNVCRGYTNQLTESILITPQIIPAGNSSTSTEYSYLDENVQDGQTYYYWLEMINLDLSSGFFGPLTVTVSDEEPPLPPETLTTSLEQNYPNPFNPETTIRFTLGEKAIVNLTVYNLLGQVVITLVDDELEAGEHRFLFTYPALPSGLYFYRLMAGDLKEAKKMLLLK